MKFKLIFLICSHKQNWHQLTLQSDCVGSLPGLNFTNILLEVFCTFFFLLITVRLCNFLTKQIGAKAIFKMLVKLTTGYTLCVSHCSSNTELYGPEKHRKVPKLFVGLCSSSLFASMCFSHHWIQLLLQEQTVEATSFERNIWKVSSFHLWR